MNNNPLSWNEIINRIFYVFPLSSQKQIAEQLNVSPDLVSGWKKGRSKPTWEQLTNICHITKTKIEWLLLGRSGGMRFLVEVHSKQLGLFANEWLYRDAVRSAIKVMVMAIWSEKSEPDFDSEAAEISNRLFFIAFNKPSPLDLIAEIEGKDRADRFVMRPDIEKRLFRLGYGTYRSGFEVISKAFNDLQIDSAALKIFRPYKVGTLDVNRYNTAAIPSQIGIGFPVRGLAAADDSHGTRVPDTDDFDDPIIPPRGMTFVPVIGDSMSPVILSGQYAVIDSEREGFEADGGIVVASILEPEFGDERSESMTGTFVKRCYDGGNGLYYFTSVNEYSPFSAWHDHCRIWPVIGVWFAGKGKPPEGD